MIRTFEEKIEPYFVSEFEILATSDDLCLPEAQRLDRIMKHLTAISRLYHSWKTATPMQKKHRAWLASAWKEFNNAIAAGA